MGPTACSISSSPESEHSRVGTERSCVTSRLGVDPRDDGLRQLSMHTGFAGKSKGHLGEGQHGNVLGGEHGGPVPAKLTQTAKEMGRVGKRPTPVVTTRCPLRCPHPIPKMVRNNSSLGLLLSILQSQFPCFALLRVRFASKGVRMRTQLTPSLEKEFTLSQ
jgi:hypothetical protein